jgi:uncharacterized protein (DUF362 family)
VVKPALAVVAGATKKKWHHRNPITHLDIGNALADLQDLAGKLMAQNLRGL